MPAVAQASSVVSSRVLTVPNLLTFLRLALVPVFLWFVIAAWDALALVVLVVAGVTDFLDGFLARRLHQVSRLGQRLDPAADRLYIFAALVGLACRELLPWWLVVVIVARDVMLLILGIVLTSHGRGALPVNRVGKIATFALLVALPVVMIGAAFPVIAAVSSPVGWAIAGVGAFLYWWAGVLYISETVRVLHPRVPEGAASDTLSEEEVDGG